MSFKAFSGKLEEFWNRLDIPVGVADIDMAHVAGKLRQFPPHVEAHPVPFDKPTSRETVTKILKPWPTTDAPTPSGYPQADGTGHPGKRATGYTARHSFAAFGDEERLCCRLRTEFIALLCIARKGRACRVIDWNEAGLPEL
jgi:hypothetical protein